MIYLENAASTPLLPEVAEFYAEQMKKYFGNPHADYQYAHDCKSVIRKAEKQIKTAIGNNDVNIVWTSGGSESINTVIKGIGLSSGDEVITSIIEHPAVFRPLEELEKKGINRGVRFGQFGGRSWIRFRFFCRSFGLSRYNDFRL